MQGKQVAITGATAGIGRETALALATMGASLTLFCRNPDKAGALAEEIAQAAGAPPRIIDMDMNSLDSVRNAASEFVAGGQSLDVLLNNAGLINTSRRESADGFEQTLAVNHFAPFLLTGLLLPALQSAPAARIVNVASHAHTFVRGMDFDDMQAERGYKTFHEYGRSKLANMLFTRELSRRLQASPMTVNSLHPGTVSTSLGSQNGGLLSKLVPLLLKPFFLSPRQGASTSIYLCTSPEVAQVSGEYFVNSKIGKAKSWALDDAAAVKLWHYSEDCVGFNYPL